MDADHDRQLISWNAVFGCLLVHMVRRSYLLKTRIGCPGGSIGRENLIEPGPNKCRKSLVLPIP